jgi:hypothetical protein
MSFSMEIGSTRLSNEVSNLMVTSSSTTGPTGPAGLPGPTGPAGSGVQMESYPVSLVAGVSGTGSVYKVGNTVYWSFSVYIPPGDYSTSQFLLVSPGFIFLPIEFRNFFGPYIDNSDNSSNIYFTNMNRDTGITIDILRNLPAGGQTSLNFSYQL